MKPVADALGVARSNLAEQCKVDEPKPARHPGAVIGESSEKWFTDAQSRFCAQLAGMRPRESCTSYLDGKKERSQHQNKLARLSCLKGATARCSTRRRPRHLQHGQDCDFGLSLKSQLPSGPQFCVGAGRRRQSSVEAPCNSTFPSWEIVGDALIVGSPEVKEQLTHAGLAGAAEPIALSGSLPRLQKLRQGRRTCQ
jgi:hypothetical protein